VIVNVPMLEPAGIVTDAGQVAYWLVQVIVTTAPPAGATALRVTVAIVEDPPVTVAGEKVIV